MDEKEKEILAETEFPMDGDEQDFDLEDILKEFSDEESAFEEEETEESFEDEEEEDEESFEDEGEEGEESYEEEEEAAEEAQIAEPAVTGDTIRLDKLDSAQLETVPMEQTQRIEIEETLPVDKASEYDQQASFVASQPIIFLPRSQLRELKRKLIAGPEKRYYDLSEQGIGRLQIAIILSILVVLVSAGTTAMFEMGMVPENRMKLMVFGQFFAMLVSALLGVYQLLDGLVDLTRKRFTLNTLLVVTLAVCCIDGVYCLDALRIPCCAAFSLQVTMSLLGEYHKRNIEMGQMDTMRKATRLHSLSRTPDYYEGRPGILRGEGEVEDFMDNYEKLSGPEKATCIYAFLALLAAIGLGVAGSMLHNMETGFQVAAVTLLAAAPASFFVANSRPMAILEKRLHRIGTVLCGWKGVKALSGRVAFPLEHRDLFPAGAVKMNGVKFYGSRDPDIVVEYATSLITVCGGGLVGLFESLLASRNGLKYPVENFRHYTLGGIGGEIDGEPVLVGTMSFLKDMGVEIPEGIRVNQAVYVAVDGELCGLFALTYEKQAGVASGMSTLCAYRSIKSVMTDSDFMLTESFVRGKFGVNTRRMAFPEEAVRQELREKKLTEQSVVGALTTKQSLESMAYALTGARCLRTACRLGTGMHIFAGVVGIVMMAVLTMLGRMDLLTPANMFLYELVWLIPGWLITEWTRSV